MTLPLSRNRTYSPGDPIRSSDLNDIQDQIIGAKHGELELMIAAAAAQPGDVATNPTFDTSGRYWEHAGSNNAVYTALPLAPGDIIRRWEVWGRENTSTYSALLLRITMATGAQATIGSKVSGTGVGVITSVVAGPDADGLPYTVLDDECIVMQVSLAGTGNRYYGMKLTYDRS